MSPPNSAREWLASKHAKDAVPRYAAEAAPVGDSDESSSSPEEDTTDVGSSHEQLAAASLEGAPRPSDGKL